VYLFLKAINAQIGISSRKIPQMSGRFRKL
jgi:hypothetical protein